MTQLIINIEDRSVVDRVHDLLKSIKGVSIEMPNPKPGIEEALEDIREGRVKRHASVEDFFKDLGI